MLVRGFFDVLVRHRGQSFLARSDFVHAILLGKAFDGAVHVPSRELFNDRFQLRIALAYDVVQMGGANSEFLELAWKSASFRSRSQALKRVKGRPRSILRAL